MLHLHRAERADRLVAALAGVLADPLPDPFQPEVVSVPTRGIERFLAQRLAATLGSSADRADGVCANVHFPFPGHLVGGAVAAVRGGGDGDRDPWLPERSVWPLLQVVDDCLDEAWLAALAAHLGHGRGATPDDGAGDGHRRGRRFAAVRHIADLYDRYAVHRPAMIRAWATGDDVDAHGRPLTDDVAWQARLWRCLRDRIGAESPAERLAGACDRLRQDADLVDLPARIALFGLTRLPASYLDVLRALAVHRDVHLLLLHPSPVLWDALAAAPVPRRLLPRDEDTSATVARNPLLAAWGRDAREMQLVLAGGDDERHHTHPLERTPTSLLERLQEDIRADRAPPGAPVAGQPDRRMALDPGDDSVQIHACHGRARQVEVVRDAILHLLAADETLEPRDVVIMCPDIEGFAPLISATFGVGRTGEDEWDLDGLDPPPARGLPDLRVRLADRSIRQTNPVLGVVSELLGLASARLTASQVVDLASREPVRRRFGFDDADLARIEEWIAATGVRWGLDGPHRAPFELDALDANTWRTGLDRLLVGVTMSEVGLRQVTGVLPHDDVGSGDIDLAGRLAELVDRLARAVDVLGGPHDVATWAAALAESADALTATSDQDTWQRAELQRLLDGVVEEATVGERRAGTPLELAEVTSLLADRLRGRPTRANFRTGHLTACTLVPMRSVPHRVVCLLGLDDGAFPRQTSPDGDDLIQRDPCVGDRDPRSEDRQLLLDAVLAARDHLIVAYSGRDERTNAPRPPAVPVGELLDVVDATARTDDGEAARSQVLVTHPLQPFDARNFAVGGLVPARRWSFDPIALDGALAAQADRQAPGPFLPVALPPTRQDVVAVDDLVRFVQHPVRAFLRQRLGITLTDEGEDPEDAIPIELDPLQQWAVGDRLLEAHLAGIPPAVCRQAELARGQLPPGRLGEPTLAAIARRVERIAAVADEVVRGAPPSRSSHLHLDLGDGRVLAGTVAGLHGGLLRSVTYSRIGPKHRLAAWVRLLALTAADPGGSFAAVTVGRAPERSGIGVARIPPLGEDPAQTARVHLGVLLDLYERGLREPLPLYCKSSAAYARAVHAGEDDPVSAARGEWESGYERPREDVEAEHMLVLGGAVAFDDLLGERPATDEDGDGWRRDEVSRFGRYACRLWEGLLAHEELSVR